MDIFCFSLGSDNQNVQERIAITISVFSVVFIPPFFFILRQVRKQLRALSNKLKPTPCLQFLSKNHQAKETTCSLNMFTLFSLFSRISPLIFFQGNHWTKRRALLGNDKLFKFSCFIHYFLLTPHSFGQLVISQRNAVLCRSNSALSSTITNSRQFLFSVTLVLSPVKWQNKQFLKYGSPSTGLIPDHAFFWVTDVKTVQFLHILSLY